MAAYFPASGLPTKRKFFLPITTGRMEFSAGYSNVRISGFILIIWIFSGFGDSCLIYLFFMPNPEDNVFVWYSKSAKPEKCPKGTLSGLLLNMLIRQERIVKKYHCEFIRICFVGPELQKCIRMELSCPLFLVFWGIHP